MEINQNAPIVLKHEISVFAPPQRVWERLAQVEYWSGWHPDIGKSEWTDDEPMDRRGFIFGVKMFRFKAKLRIYDEPLVIGWEAHNIFSTHRQVFRIDGDFRQTVITSEASYEGPATKLISNRLRTPLDRFGQTWLAAIKTNIEAARESNMRLPGARRPRPD
jgi:hypothetical protein|tara:strand:- start:110 stop:595 length:486 start_codon:yes stop_codon:yes gene_type:complete